MSSRVAESTEARHANSRLWWISSLCLFCALVIALLSWAYRYSMNPDGMSYLDMADQLLQGHFSALIHPYWSPLYPTLLALALKIFSPTLPHELLVVHFVNFLIGLGALASFTFFLVQWTRLRGFENIRDAANTSFRLQTTFAYLLFLWCTSELIGLGSVTPDLCVAAVVFLIAGLCCRLAGSRAGWGTAASLGLALSFGYFSKAAMLPLGFALLVILSIPRLFALPRRSRLAVSGLVFFFAIAPQIFLMSRQAHHLTFGDAGRLNYAWLVVQEVPAHQGWIASTADSGTPVHPLRVLSANPTVFEFKNTVPGTYPLWYNPAYFYDGLRTRFDLHKQRDALIRSSQSFVVSLGRKQIPLLVGFIILCVFAIRRRTQGRLPRINLSSSWLILWSLTAFAMYGLVGIEPRYIASFVIIFWLVLYQAVSPETISSLRLPRLAVLTAVVACFLFSEFYLLWSTAAYSLRDRDPSSQVLVAAELARLGLQRGDEIATVGDGAEAYYARLAELRVVSTIAFRGNENDLEKFWALNQIQFNSLKQELRSVGARAIVSPDNKKCAATSGWHSVAGTGYCVQLLN